MRVITVVLMSLAVGAAVGLRPSGRGGAESGLAGPAASADEASRPLSERLIWLRTPAMQRAAGPRQ